MKPLVGIVMGSDSDWPVMQAAATMLKEFGVPYEARVVSAHRTPDLLFDYAAMAQERDLRAIIAGAGGAASKHLNGLDSLLSIVQMPKGIPVATFAIGEAGAANAALTAIAIIATANDDYGRALSLKLEQFRSRQSEKVMMMKLPDA
jgi:5-(carboxyamino)imidazole ribonucleotide mutase